MSEQTEDEIKVYDSDAPEIVLIQFESAVLKCEEDSTKKAKEILKGYVKEHPHILEMADKWLLIKAIKALSLPAAKRGKRSASKTERKNRLITLFASLLTHADKDAETSFTGTLEEIFNRSDFKKPNDDVCRQVIGFYHYASSPELVGEFDELLKQTNKKFDLDKEEFIEDLIDLCPRWKVHLQSLK